MILITGGYGYLGGRIASYLLGKGEHVRIGSHRKTPIIPEELENCEHTHIDLSSKKNLLKSCEGVSCLIHLAALNVAECNENPEKAHVINAIGTRNMITAAADSGVTRFIYFSTAHVYGSPLQGNFHEDSPVHPTNTYSVTHRDAENFVKQIGKTNDMQTTIFRLTNAVGTPVGANANCWMLVVNDLCKQVITQQEMKLRSSPSLLRDYVPISTICKVVYQVILNDNLHEEIMNLSSGESMSLQEIADMIASRASQTLGIDAPVTFEQPSYEGAYLHIPNKKLMDLEQNNLAELTNEIDVLLHNCNNWFSKVTKR